MSTVAMGTTLQQVAARFCRCSNRATKAFLGLSLRGGINPLHNFGSQFCRGVPRAIEALSSYDAKGRATDAQQNNSTKDKTLPP
jgi:hypothetical protein